MRNLLSLLALLVLCMPQLWATPVTAMATDHPNSQDPGRASSPANLTSITAAGVTWSGSQLVPITEVFSANDSGLYLADSLATPTFPVGLTTADVFTDLDITSGKANSVDMNLIFASPFQDLNGSLPNLAITELAAGSQGDEWTVRAIVGGTAAVPVFGGAPFTFIQNGVGGFGDTLNQVGVRRSSDVNVLNQDMYGVGIDFGELGITSETVIGVRVISAGGDPSLVVGLVPEPQSFSLFAIGLLALARTFRRSC